MQLELKTCECCRRTIPPEQYRPAIATCIECEALPVHVAVRTARSAALNEARSGEQAKRTRQQARQAQYLAVGKKCGICWAYKPPSDFHNCAPRPDGLQANCIQCNTTYDRLTKAGVSRQQWIAIRDTMRAQSATQRAAIEARLPDILATAQ